MVEDSYNEEPTLAAARTDALSQPAVSVAGGLAVGEMIASRYRLVERIGAGAMGVVWQAEDTRLGRNVAIKILHPDAADADGASRLRHEAKLLAQIEHVNVVRVFDAGVTELGRPFVVMERVRGESLGRHVTTEGALAWPAAIELAIQIADGLACVHDLGIIHRDLKPANILVLGDTRGRSTPKLIDFGLAKGSRVSDRTRIPTRTGEVFGTPAYMSPEQVRGETVDVRTDIYAFGVLLFELLAGHRMWRYPSVVEVLYAQLHEPAPLLRLHAPDVPLEIEAIVARCVAKRLEDRFPDAHALRSALQGAGMRGATVAPSAMQRPVGTPAGAQPRGQGATGLIFGGLAVAVAAGFAVTWLVLSRPGTPPSHDPAGGDAPADDAPLLLDEPSPPAVARPPSSPPPEATPAPIEVPRDEPPADATPVDAPTTNAVDDRDVAPSGTPIKPRTGTKPKVVPPRSGDPKPTLQTDPKPEPKPDPTPQPEPPVDPKPDEKPTAKPKVGPSGTFDPFG